MANWYSLLMSVGLTLSAVAPFTPPPYDKVLITLGQVCISIADSLNN
jgi:hypothetical protein